MNMPHFYRLWAGFISKCGIPLNGIFGSCTWYSWGLTKWGEFLGRRRRRRRRRRRPPDTPAGAPRATAAGDRPATAPRPLRPPASRMQLIQIKLGLMSHI